MPVPSQLVNCFLPRALPTVVLHGLFLDVQLLIRAVFQQSAQLFLLQTSQEKQRREDETPQINEEKAFKVLENPENISFRHL